ncbi:hypothetical protein XPR_1246 [Xanthomonas arboricola pv. pruni MAFF 301420]|uniref:Uncharacterized protein n=2 Tax=Xanthomonas arboricola pv. pruni TaxID=69929 RepID=W4SDL7_9XANT|nr:hypothetical protein XPU_4124 [Xanthomonas arboricola pv. pruni str. MAFF 311562]GAE54611.1 hypothetical protein XPR_1246 [Xanthomonas arboricola pv. pruni MAFF 301420]GAE61085.1 hypothetical protein XPN_2991 [Xanthomonas arboricola pv. pruni MAFF 301427]
MHSNKGGGGSVDVDVEVEVEVEVVAGGVGATGAGAAAGAAAGTSVLGMVGGCAAGGLRAGDAAPNPPAVNGTAAGAVISFFCCCMPFGQGMFCTVSAPLESVHR